MSEGVAQWFAKWFGRQVGHVKTAIDTTPEQTVYENKQVQEQPHPEDPNIVLRRTTIDQAVKKNDKI